MNNRKVGWLKSFNYSELPREVQVEEGKTHDFLLYLSTDKLRDLGVCAGNEQYFFDVDICDVVTCGTDGNGNYTVLSKTMKEE